jgi:hypothetical protein
MKVVSEDVSSAMDRWHAAFKLSSAKAAPATACIEFQQACLALSAALDEADCVPADLRHDVNRWDAEGGRA